MSATDERVLTGPRWSLICRTGCARVAVYGAQHAPEDELTPEQHAKREARFQLGHDLSNAHRDRDMLDLRDEGWECIAEAEIPWPKHDPIGTGHADVFAIRQNGDGDVEESAIIEYTTRVDAVLDEHKVLQAGGYALNAGASAATVVSIDPASGRKQNYPIDVEGVAERVHTLEQAAAEAVRSGHAERVCQHPGDGRARLCPYVTHCFADWEPTPIDQVIGMDEKVRALADAEDAYAETAAAMKEAKAARDALREELRAYIPPNEKVVGAVDVDGVIEVRRSVFDKSTFSLSDARKAGHAVPVELAAFEKTHSEERWSVRRVGAS